MQSTFSTLFWWRGSHHIALLLMTNKVSPLEKPPRPGPRGVSHQCSIQRQTKLACIPIKLRGTGIWIRRTWGFLKRSVPSLAFPLGSSTLIGLKIHCTLHWVFYKWSHSLWRFQVGLLHLGIEGRSNLLSYYGAKARWPRGSHWLKPSGR